MAEFARKSIENTFRVLTASVPVDSTTKVLDEIVAKGADTETILNNDEILVYRTDSR